MGRKLTNEEFLQKLQKLGRDDLVPLEEYAGTNIKILFKCTNLKCQHEWKAKPGTILEGCGCPKCAVHRGIGGKPKTKEEIQKKIDELGRDIIVLTDYAGGKSKIKVKSKICNHEWEITYKRLIDKREGPKCQKCHREEMKEKYKLSKEEVEKRIREANPDIELVGEYTNYYVPVKLRCKKDGYEWEQILDNFVREAPYCPLCEKDKTYKLIPGVNDIATLRPDLVKYFINKEDASNLKTNSNKRMFFKCPDCGYEKDMVVYALCGIGFSCPKCKDKISYPNKFLRAFLNQLEIDYDLEWHDDWCSRYRYDAHFVKDGVGYLVEFDGGQHFGKKDSYFKTQKEDIKSRDIQKNRLAKENGFVLIRIDCCKSDGEYIKNNIFKSLFNEIFDLSEINWKQCFSEAEKSLVKQVCDYYNSNINIEIKELAKKFKIASCTARDYINRGVKAGFTRDLESKYYGIKLTLYKNDKKIASYGSYFVLERRSELDLGFHCTREVIRTRVQKHNGELKGFKIKIAETLDDIADNYYK